MSFDKSRNNDSLSERGMERSLEGKADNIKGKMKDVAGGVTGDNKLKAEGKMDQAKGKIKDAIGNAERKIGDKMTEREREEHRRK